MRFTGSGKPVLNGGIAVNERWTDGETGEKKEKTTFIDFTIWGKQAETFLKHTRIGSSVMISGRISLDEYKKDDEKRKRHFVTVEEFQFLDKAPESNKAPTRRENG